MKEFQISVHERLDAPGYVVRIGFVENGEVVNPIKYPVDSFEEAEALAKSMKRYADTGCDVYALMGLDPENSGK